MEAYQYKIRKEKETIEIIDFKKSEVSLKNTSIKLIDRNTAKDIIIQYEWLGTMPVIVNYCFGLYFKINNKEYLGGVLVFSIDYAENTGVWKKYGFDDKLLLLSRGVCLWWTPKNSASYFISKASKWLKNNTKYRILTATIDPAAGEVGIIYQSLNWFYTGVMSGNYSHNREIKRFSVIIDGKLRGSRWVREKYGTIKKEIILQHHPDAVFVPQYRKRRYFYFMDTKRNNKKYYNAIKHLIQAYPKKNENIVGIIYKIKNKITNKIYIGQTIRSLKNRINDYKRGYGNDYINNSFNKYGFDKFEFSIIDTAQTLEELNSKEKQYILKYKSYDRKYGYNIELGGDNAIPSEETLNKMSKSHSGIKQTEVWIKKRIASAGSEEAKKYGKKKTDEEKKYLSEHSPKYWLGKKRDEETRKKISETKKKKGVSEKQIKACFKTVYKINVDTNKIEKTFISTNEAAKHEGVNQSTVSRWCKKDKIVKGFKWSYNSI